MARCFEFLQWEHAMIQGIFLMSLRVGGMIHSSASIEKIHFIFQRHGGKSQLFPWHEATNGWCSQQAGSFAVLLRFRWGFWWRGSCFCLGGEASTWGTRGKKGSFFRVETEIPTKALRWPPITTTTTSTNSRWGEMLNSRHRKQGTWSTSIKVFIILNSNLISINMWFSQSSFFMIFFSLHSHKNHSHLIPHFHSFLQGDTPLPVPRGFLFLHLEAVYGWLHQGSDCSWDFHVLFQRKRWHWK